METVRDIVIEQCRNAMLAHIPIIYIKTDSFELIREIVDSDRLVMRICDAPSVALSYMADRPYRELEKLTEPLARSKPKNWIENEQLIDKCMAWTVPHIVTIAGEWNSNAGGFHTEGFSLSGMKRLREYVKAYLSPDCGNIDILYSSAVILYARTLKLSPDLLQYTKLVEVPYPNRDEIRSIILDEITDFGECLDNKEQLESLCSDFSGLTKREIINTMHEILTRAVPQTQSEDTDSSPLNDTRAVQKIIHGYKQQKIQGSDVLSLEKIDKDERIGGMDNLRKWIGQINEKRALTDAALLRRRDGIEPPKGVLLCGIPGCGKSLAAKLTAGEFNLPLLKMDVGNLMGGIVGESEERMRRALGLAEAMSPCVLWIDELEKGFSGATGHGGDSHTFKRMFATLLSWMQDNKKPCFLFATANDISGLPPEFFRSGRFDELFAVYMPTAGECVDIFKARAAVAVKKTEKERESLGMAPLFAEECLCDDIYLKLLNSSLFVTDKKLRMVIGADIQKIVNQAQTILSGRGKPAVSITASEWEKALKEASQACTVFGDSEENLDSIALRYCRMLRKGMKPTVDSSQLLFKNEDYHGENARVKEGSTGAEVLQPSLDEHLLCPYDRAMYRLLLSRINKTAARVEEIELEKMIRG